MSLDLTYFQCLYLAVNLLVYENYYIGSLKPLQSFCAQRVFCIQAYNAYQCPSRNTYVHICLCSLTQKQALCSAASCSALLALWFFLQTSYIACLTEQVECIDSIWVKIIWNLLSVLKLHHLPQILETVLLLFYFIIFFSSYW